VLFKRSSVCGLGPRRRHVGRHCLVVVAALVVLQYVASVGISFNVPSPLFKATVERVGIEDSHLALGFGHAQSPPFGRLSRGRRADATEGDGSSADDTEGDGGSAVDKTKENPGKDAASKSEMLKFALPALGIYLAGPIMSNIDNSFVGRYADTASLAALAPGGVLADNLLYLFAAVLGSATTGLVARAWPKGADKARDELTLTISFALAIGVPLTLFYVFFSRWAMGFLPVAPEIMEPAAAYARIRGLVAFAALSQGVCLSAILATRDAVTPLKVVLTAAALNCTGDFLFCCWPLQTGVVGAAAATSLSTLAGVGLMLRALKSKGIMPRLQWPDMKKAGPVLEYAGPMFVITVARIAGFTGMAFTAASLGTTTLAAYQVIIGIFVLCAFVGAPLSQTAQSMIPALVDANDKEGTRRVGKNVLSIASIVSVAVSTICFLVLRFGAGAFTSDATVLAEAAGAAPAVALATATLLISSSVDGALLAAKDFGFVVPQQVIVLSVQLVLLQLVRRWNLGLPYIFLTFVFRLWVFIACASLRIGLGMGPLGRVAFRRD